MDVAGAHEANKYAARSLDTVICNGVSMYFPSADYLLAVISTSVAAVGPGGSFYLGDVRACTLLPHFHTSVQLFQAPDDLPVTELRSKVRLTFCCSVPSAIIAESTGHRRRVRADHALTQV